MSRSQPRADSPTQRIVLLAGQAFALGLTMAWIVVPASAIFLDTYGSRLLPVTYIGAALAGIASSALLTTALRRRPLVRVATRVLAGLSLTLLACWIVLWKAGADWVSFGLLVLIPIGVPVGFMFVVGQAGMLLDVRVLKALYGRVVAGFALGFVTGGASSPFLLGAFGRAEHLLAVAAGASALFLGLIVVTRRRFPTELAAIEHHDPSDAERPTLRLLLRRPYITLIVAFQMLSAVESQWLDYLVFDRAAQRYHDSRELAQFISRFTAIAYGADIVFLLVLAGLLLRRFGLRYGLTANPLGVLALLFALIVTASVQGSGATLVFVLVVAARVTDLTLSDGAARTSLSAAYQAVPTPLRLATQAGVEGLAVPVAIGASGVVLLALQLMGGTGGLALPVLTSVVVVAWTVVAAFVYRGYRTNLLASLRRRTLDPSELTIDGAAGLSVIQRLVESDDERDVRLALDALTVAAHADLSTALQRLTTDGRIGVRIDALERLAELDPQQGASAARTGLDDPSHHVRAVCLRVLAESGEPSDLPSIAAHTADESTEVRIAVAAAMAHLGDDDVRAEIAGEISRLSQHQGVDQRIIAAQMLGACGSAGSIDRSALGVLLADSEHDVANEALAATRWPDDDELIVQVADRLHDRATGSAAMEALARGNDATLEFIDRSLSGHEYGRRGQELLARVCREMGGASAALVLRRHVEHLDREVGLAVMTALSAVLGSPSSGADPRMESERVEASDASEAVLRVDLEHAAYVLRALLALEDETAADLLCAALRDELALTRQRVMAALSIRHGTEGLQRVAFQFAQRDPRSHALALEWLDVTLSGADRAVVAMLEPGLTDGERLRGLSRWFPIASASPLAIVRDLLEDGEHRWRRSWLTACALYALSGLSDPTLDVGTPGGIESLMKLQPHDESDIVHETLAGLRARRPSGD